jgi:hypothetical protein
MYASMNFAVYSRSSQLVAAGFFMEIGMAKFLVIHHDPLEGQALFDQIVADDSIEATRIADQIRGAYSNHVVTLSVDELCQIEWKLCDRSEEDILAEQSEMLAGA